MPTAVPEGLAAADEPDSPDPAVLEFAGAAELEPGLRGEELADQPETITEAPRIQHGTRERTHARELFVRLSGLPPGDAERLRIRGELVELHLPLV